MIPWVRPKDDLDLETHPKAHTRTHGNTHISTLAYVTLCGSLKAFTIHHRLQGVCSFYVKNQTHNFLKKILDLQISFSTGQTNHSLGLIFGQKKSLPGIM
jgi:hypothetical protein